MFPKINIYGKEISTYAICAAVGLGFCILLMHFLIKNRRDVYKACLGVMAVFAGVGMFIGAHIVYTITRIDAITELFNHWDYYMSSWDKALMMLGSIFGGMVFYGGLFGGLGGAALYCRIKKLSFLHYADIFAPVIPLFHAFGRIGCLMAGCCYGIESEFGFHTTPHVEGVADVSRFPVQLVECFGTTIRFMFHCPTTRPRPMFQAVTSVSSGGKLKEKNSYQTTELRYETTIISPLSDYRTITLLDDGPGRTGVHHRRHPNIFSNPNHINRREERQRPQCHCPEAIGDLPVDRRLRFRHYLFVELQPAEDESGRPHPTVDEDILGYRRLWCVLRQDINRL